MQWTRVANLYSPEKARPCPQKSQKKTDSSFETYTHKKRITKHKTDIKTRQKHRYNKISIIRSSFLSRNYTLIHLFLTNNIDHFQVNSKIFAIFCTPCMVMDSRQRRFVMNMQFRQCFAWAKPFRLKKARTTQILSGFFWIPIKAIGIEKKPELQNLASRVKLTALQWTSQNTGKLLIVA